MSVEKAVVDIKAASVRRTPGYVYVIESMCKSRVKIGRSVNPRRRVSSISTMSGGVGRVLVGNKVPDPVTLETYLHTMFARDRAVGEWFNIRFDVVAPFVAAVSTELSNSPCAPDIEADRHYLMLDIDNPDRSITLFGVTVAQNSEHCYNLNTVHKAAIDLCVASASQRPANFIRSQQPFIQVAKTAGEVITVTKGGLSSGTYATNIIAKRYAGWIDPNYELIIYRR